MSQLKIDEANGTVTVSRIAETDKHCVFGLGDSLFALPATCLLEVAENPGVKAVPGTDSVLAGVCHLRNEFLAVIDLRTLAGEDRVNFGDQQLLVIHGSNGPWAVLVDRIVGLEALEVSISQDIHAADDWMAAMIGSATLCNRAVRVLEPTRIYRLADNMIRRWWAGVTVASRREMTNGSNQCPVVADASREDCS